MSLARRHRDRCLAQASARAAAPDTLERPSSGPEATAYELILAKLGADLRQLREIQSIEKKIDLKRELLPAYDPWVQGVLAAVEAEGATGVQDEILVQTMIWRIDVGDYAGALPLIDYVLRWGLALPERFNRTAATMIAEEIADAALKALGQGESFDFELLQMVEARTRSHDMHDQVRAKMMKAMGLELARRGADIETDADGPAGAKRSAIEGALALLRRALELNGRVGVKKEIERLEREAAKVAVAPGN